MTNNEVILHLSLIPGIGPGVVERIIAHKSWDIELTDLYSLRVADFVTCLRLTPAKADLIVKGLADRALLEKELANIEQHGIAWMTIFHGRYPAMLRAIHLPPLVLYWRGADLWDNEQRLAVIGSRAINLYGIAAIEQLVPPLVREGWTIVSGGALGADSVAHQVALDAGGKTIVVMGSGLLQPYPTSNNRLFRDVVSHGGMVISSFSLMKGADTGTFPARNRIIAGISKGCLVVQAKRHSGTRITATYALEQGKELFAVPGPIDDELSAGCHALIQEGAKLVATVDDIVSEFGLLCRQQTVLPPVDLPRPFHAQGQAAAIMRYCQSPCSIDDLVATTGMTVSELYTVLFELEISGLIKQHANGLWQRC